MVNNNTLTLMRLERSAGRVRSMGRWSVEHDNDVELREGCFRVAAGHHFLNDRATDQAEKAGAVGWQECLTGCGFTALKSCIRLIISQK